MIFIFFLLILKKLEHFCGSLKTCAWSYSILLTMWGRDKGSSGWEGGPFANTSKWQPPAFPAPTSPHVAPLLQTLPRKMSEIPPESWPSAVASYTPHLDVSNTPGFITPAHLCSGCSLLGKHSPPTCDHVTILCKPPHPSRPVQCHFLGEIS